MISLDSSTLRVVLVAAILLTLLSQWAVRKYKLRKIPVLNRATWFNASTAKDNWRWNARKLLYDGFRKARLSLLSSARFDGGLTETVAERVHGRHRLPARHGPVAGIRE
jgi:hypothetical protein